VRFGLQSLMIYPPNSVDISVHAFQLVAGTTESTGGSLKTFCYVPPQAGRSAMTPIIAQRSLMLPALA